MSAFMIFITGCAGELKGYASVADVGDETKKLNLEQLPVNGVLTFLLTGFQSSRAITFEEGKSFDDIDKNCKVSTDIDKDNPATLILNKRTDDVPESYEIKLLFTGLINVDDKLDSNDTYLQVIAEYHGLSCDTEYNIGTAGFIGIYDSAGTELICTIDISGAFALPTNVKTIHSWVDTGDGKTHKCSVCGGVANHNYEDGMCACGEIDICNHGGITSGICPDCGKELSHVKGVFHEAVPATCEVGGVKEYYECAGCGAFLDEDGALILQDLNISPLGHSFTYYVSDNNATCETDGTKTAICDRCDKTDTKTDIGSAIGEHDFSDGATKCKVCGKCKLFLDTGAHKFNGSSCQGVCTMCGVKNTSGTHIFIDEYGSYLIRCKDCDEAEAPKCGENAYYAYDEITKTLHIYGSGDLYIGAFEVSYADNSTDAKKQRALIAQDMKKVIIGKDITILSLWSFCGYDAMRGYISQLETVEFEEDCKLSIIDEAAFRDCTNLSNIVLPNKLERIGTEAFLGCVKLTDIVIPQSVSTIGVNSFDGCDNLLCITILNPSVDILSHAFVGCDKLESIHLSCLFDADNNFAKQASTYWNTKNIMDISIIKKDIHDFSLNPEVCRACGTYKDSIGAKLAGYSLSLQDTIGVDFYMELADKVIKDEDAKFVFKISDGSFEEIPVREAKLTEVNGKTYYVFECYVAAKQMTDTITAKIVLGDDTEGTEYQFTVQDYAKYILEHESEYEEVLPLVKAMLSYGASAQNYFSYNTDKLADTILAEADRNVSLTTPELTSYNYSVPKEADTVSFLGTSLVLESEVGLKCYFYAADDLQYSNVTVKLGDKVLDESDFIIGKSGAAQYIMVTGLAPSDYGKQFTITAHDITVENVSVYGYMNQAFKIMGDSDKLTDVLKNMYAYGEVYKKCYK